MEQITVDEVSEERAKRFYDRLRESIHEFARGKGTIGRTAEFLMLVPDMFMLLWRLTTDKRVSGKNKILLGSGVAYFILPFDLIPEAIVGPIGYMDDLVFAVYVLSRVLSDTDPAILREHWAGEGDVLEKIRHVLSAADTVIDAKVAGKLKKLMKR